MTSDPATPPTLGAILAGGLARRLGGGDKPLRMVGGRTVLARLIDRLAPQVTRLMLNANDDPRSLRGVWACPLSPTALPDHPGPLAGVLAALEWVALSDPPSTGCDGSGRCSVPPARPRPTAARRARSRTTRPLRALHRKDGRTPSPRYGPCHSATRCATRWRRTASGKWTCSRSAIHARSAIGRQNRWTRSSTSIRRRTWPRRIALSQSTRPCD